MVRVSWNGRRRNPAIAGAAWLIGAVATLIAACVAVVLAVMFAATVALLAVFGGGLLAAWAMVWKMRRTPQLQRAAAGPMILDARKVGHSWVAYGWDQARG